MEEKWVVSAKKADFQAIGQKFGIDQVIARVIRNRDVIGEEQVRRYLHPQITDLHSSALLRGAQEAAEAAGAISRSPRGLSSCLRQRRRQPCRHHPS